MTLQPFALALLISFSVPAFSASHLSPKDYYGDVKLSTTKEIKSQLAKILQSHAPLSYKQARRHLFGDLSLAGTTASTYNVETIYCHQKVTNKDFHTKKALGPMQIPDERVVNAEHSWPQSKFTGQFPKSTQKGDLHILFPVLATVNSIRGNFPYGEVVTPMNAPCNDAALGKSTEGETVFEPADEDKGNVARAIFYFSVRYKAGVTDVQERYLRTWHKLDPVDEDEEARNDAIFEIQNNRNPFIDNPSLVEKVENF
jgi:deoxyribonuclease I